MDDDFGSLNRGFSPLYRNLQLVLPHGVYQDPSRQDPSDRKDSCSFLPLAIYLNEPSRACSIPSSARYDIVMYNWNKGGAHCAAQTLLFRSRLPSPRFFNTED
jgi:hypothetical protein